MLLQNRNLRSSAVKIGPSPQVEATSEGMGQFGAVWHEGAKQELCCGCSGPLLAHCVASWLGHVRLNSAADAWFDPTQKKLPGSDDRCV